MPDKVEQREGGQFCYNYDPFYTHRCSVCGLPKPPIGRSVAMAAAGGYCCPVDCEGYRLDPQPPKCWPGEFVCSKCRIPQDREYIAADPDICEDCFMETPDA